MIIPFLSFIKHKQERLQNIKTEGCYHIIILTTVS